LHLISCGPPAAAFLTVEEPAGKNDCASGRHYAELNNAIDFWLIRSPAFLAAGELQALAASVPFPKRGQWFQPIKFITSELRR